MGLVMNKSSTLVSTVQQLLIIDRITWYLNPELTLKYFFLYNFFPPHLPDHENFYEGRVFGETISEVSAHLEDGIMTATIHTPEDTYHVEASAGYSFYIITYYSKVNVSLIALFSFWGVPYQRLTMTKDIYKATTVEKSNRINI